MKSSEKPWNTSCFSGILDHWCFSIEHLFSSPETSVLWQMLRNLLWEKPNEFISAVLRSSFPGSATGPVPRGAGVAPLAAPRVLASAWSSGSLRAEQNMRNLITAVWGPRQHAAGPWPRQLQCGENTESSFPRQQTRPLPKPSHSWFLHSRVPRGQSPAPSSSRLPRAASH